MGRRKKEPANTHRENIAAAAAQLFQTQGSFATTMDDIAKKAGYSKATLYVYFTSKQEIISLLAMKSMQQMHDRLQMTLQDNHSSSVSEKYRLICQTLLQYQAEQPLFFQMLLDKINTNPADPDYLPEERAAYQIGESINSLLSDFLLEGIARGELRADIPILPTIFSLWGMLAGLIQLADKKEEYIAAAMQQNKEQFLTYGFQMLYRTIAENDTNDKEKDYNEPK